MRFALLFVILLAVAAPVRAQDDSDSSEPSYDDADIVPDRERVGDEGDQGKAASLKDGKVPIYDPKGDKERAAEGSPGSDVAPATAAPAAPVDGPKKKKKKRAAGGPMRVQAFLVPSDVYGGMVAGRVAGAVESELADARGYEAVDMAQELAVPVPQEIVAAVATGREQIAEGNKALIASQWVDAVAHFERAVGAFKEGALGIEAADWADAQARLGAAHALSGEEEFSQISLKAAVLADPRGLVDARNIHRSVAPALESMRARAAAWPVGSLSVNATAGARVFVDGIYRGAAPVSVERLAAGAHLVKVERAGMHPWAQFVDVAAGSAAGIKVKLKATEEAAQLNKVLTRIAAEVDAEGIGEATGALGKRFRLDRAIIGAVGGDRGKASLDLALVDFRAGKRLARGSGTWETEGDTLERETRALVRKLLSEAHEAARQIAGAGDPLDRGADTEAAATAESGSKPRTVEAVREDEAPKKKARLEVPEKKASKSKDPLQDMTGIDDY